MGAQGSIITPTTFPNPAACADKVSTHNAFNELKKFGFTWGRTDGDRESASVRVKLPAGWHLFADPTNGCHFYFYVVDVSGKIVAMLSERDVDKYCDYSRSVIICPDDWLPICAKFTYPFPDFYTRTDDGWFVLDKKSDAGKLLEMMTQLDEKYEKYLQTFDGSDTMIEDMRLCFDGTHKKLIELADVFPEWMTHVEFEQFASKDYLCPQIRCPKIERDVIFEDMVDEYKKLKSTVEFRDGQYLVDNPDIVAKSYDHFRYGPWRKYSRFVDKELTMEDIDCSYDLHSFIWNLPASPEQAFHLKSFPSGSSADNSDRIVEEFEKLLFRYNRTKHLSSGCGARGQIYIDNEYREVMEFQEKHKHIPSIAMQTVPRFTCDNDGHNGVAAGTSTFLHNF